jgi:glyoxylase-like metal-dependent hydrolase (beta-lactamase superfamily II)
MNIEPARHANTLPPLVFPFPDLPEPGTAIKIAQGVHWVRMPLPFALDHVNLWLLADGDGWTIVDAGLGLGDETRALWLKVFDATLDGRPVKRIIVTHFHPDHMGLAGWLCERFGAALWTSQAEWSAAQLTRRGWTGAEVEKRLDHYRRNGFASDKREALRARGNRYAENVTRIPVTYRRVMAGDAIEIDGQPWQVIIGRGHAPEHVCLYNPALEVLPKITTNVSVSPDEPDGDPLRLYLDSLAQFQLVQETALVLPSHGMPFRGLHSRLGQLARHHHERLEIAAEACTEPRTAAEIIPVLFRRPLDVQQLGFAMGEAMAHMHYLVGVGLLRREADSEGVYRFL